MTPRQPAELANVARRRLACSRALAAYEAALVAAIDAGHSYRAVATPAGLSVGRVHEIVATERLRRRETCQTCGGSGELPTNGRNAYSGAPIAEPCPDCG